MVIKEVAFSLALLRFVPGTRASRTGAAVGRPTAAGKKTTGRGVPPSRRRRGPRVPAHRPHPAALAVPAAVCACSNQERVCGGSGGEVCSCRGTCPLALRWGIPEGLVRISAEIRYNHIVICCMCIMELLTCTCTTQLGLPTRLVAAHNFPNSHHL
jgi:hypothetical protein